VTQQPWQSGSASTASPSSPRSRGHLGHRGKQQQQQGRRRAALLLQLLLWVHWMIQSSWGCSLMGQQRPAQQQQRRQRLSLLNPRASTSSGLLNRWSPSPCRQQQQQGVVVRRSSRQAHPPHKCQVRTGLCFGVEDVRMRQSSRALSVVVCE
jgi:hypothetical protein